MQSTIRAQARKRTSKIIKITIFLGTNDPQMVGLWHWVSHIVDAHGLGKTHSIPSWKQDGATWCMNCMSIIWVSGKVLQSKRTILLKDLCAKTCSGPDQVLAPRVETFETMKEMVHPPTFCIGNEDSLETAYILDLLNIWFILFHADVKFLPTYIRLHSCKDASMHICIYILYIYIHMHICTHIHAIYVNMGRYENQEVRIWIQKIQCHKPSPWAPYLLTCLAVVVDDWMKPKKWKSKMGAWIV